MLANSWNHYPRNNLHAEVSNNLICVQARKGCESTKDLKRISVWKHCPNDTIVISDLSKRCLRLIRLMRNPRNSCTQLGSSNIVERTTNDRREQLLKECVTFTVDISLYLASYNKFNESYLNVIYT